MPAPRTLIAAALVVLAPACTGGGGDGRGQGAGGETVFRAGIVRPASLDPARARTLDEQLVADQLYDSLVALDPETAEPVPSLAASWSASDDQRRWDFVLRPDARFADGSPITSADVKATLERIAAPDSGSTVADLLEPVTGWADVAVGASTSDLAGVTTPAPDLVRFELDEPWSVLPVVLANPAFGVVPESEARGGLRPEATVGSGPFLLSERSEDRLVLVPAAATEARTDRLEMVLFDDATQSYTAFVEGRLDWSAVPSGRVEEAVGRYGGAVSRPHLAEVFYAMNLRSPTLSDARLREAIVRTVDGRRIAGEVYGAAVLPQDGVVMAGLPEHQERACGEPCEPAPERVAGLLEAVRADHGGTVPEVQVDFEDEPVQVEVATRIRDELVGAGIPAALRPRPRAEFESFVVSGQHQLFRLGWVAPYVSADAVLAPLFRSGTPTNVAGLASAEVDELVGLARSEGDAGRRRELYRLAERAVMAQAVVVPIAQFQVHAVSSSRASGTALGATGTFDGRKVRVDSGR